MPLCSSVTTKTVLGSPSFGPRVRGWFMIRHSHARMVARDKAWPLFRPPHPHPSYRHRVPSLDVGPERPTDNKGKNY